MAKQCYTCQELIQTALDKKCAKTLSSFFRGTKVKVGKALQRTGWKVDEINWDYHSVCRPCWTVLGRWVSEDRKLIDSNEKWMKRTGRKLPVLPQKCTDGSLYKNRAMAYIQHSEYNQAFKLVRKHSRGAKKAWEKGIKDSVRKEMRALLKEKDLFAMDSKSRDLTKFNWKLVLSKVQQIAPTLFSVIVATMTKDDNDTSLKRSHTKSKIGTMLLIPLFHRKPGVNRLIPLSVATALLQRGNRKKVIKLLHQMGVSQTAASARRNIEFLKKDNERKITAWCKAIQTEGKNPPQSEDDHYWMHPGYSICISNLHLFQPVSQEQSSLIESSAFAIKNRISFRPITDTSVVMARDLPLSVFLPTQDDYEMLRERMEVIVHRMLVQLVGCSRDKAGEQVVMHIHHEHADACSVQSEFVNLGIIEANCTNIDGMTDALNLLNKHVPIIDAKPYYVPLHGSCPLAELAARSQHTCNLDPKMTHKPNGFIPVPQEFHFRTQVLQDTMDEFYKPTNAEERGSLRNLAEFFKYKNDSYDIIRKSSNNFDFMQLVTTSLVVAYAAHLMQLDSLDDTSFESDMARMDQLRHVAVEIVRQVWHQVPMSTIHSTTERHKGDFHCICQKLIDTDESSLIQCANPACQNGQWFHPECVMIDEVQPEMEFFCSPECHDVGNSKFCLCRRKIPDAPMIKCHNPGCQRGIYFHHRCIRDNIPDGYEGEWYCSAECKSPEAQLGEDHKAAYIKALMWRGLLQECMRDAEQEGDGEALMRHWRIYVPEMWNRSHTRYLASTHRLLAGVSGCLPTRLRGEIIHNRTVNIQGGPYNNIAMDLFLDMVNQEFREATLHESVGKTHESAQTSMAAIPFGLQPGQLLGLPTSVTKFLKRYRSSSTSYNRHRDDVAQFLRYYNREILFGEMPMQSLHGLPNFTYANGTVLSAPHKLKERLVNLSEEYSEFQLVSDTGIY